MLVLRFSLLVRLVFVAVPLPAGEAASTLADELSLIVPAMPDQAGPALAVFLSGDGGWAAFDREVSARLARANLPVVGWDSRAYYWKRKDPDRAAADLARIIAHFREAWARPQVVLLGYSRGADVLAFLVNRLPEEQRANIRLVVMLGLGRAIDFEFHLSDWLHEPDPKTARSVPTEVERLAGTGTPLLIIYGSQEKFSPAPDLKKRIPGIVELPGDHHFQRNYDDLARLILKRAAPEGSK